MRKPLGNENEMLAPIPQPLDFIKKPIPRDPALHKETDPSGHRAGTKKPSYWSPIDVSVTGTFITITRKKLIANTPAFVNGIVIAT